MDVTAGQAEEENIYMFICHKDSNMTDGCDEQN